MAGGGGVFEFSTPGPLITNTPAVVLIGEPGDGELRYLAGVMVC